MFSVWCRNQIQWGGLGSSVQGDTPAPCFAKLDINYQNRLEFRGILPVLLLLLVGHSIANLDMDGQQGALNSETLLNGPFSRRRPTLTSVENGPQHLSDLTRQAKATKIKAYLPLS